MDQLAKQLAERLQHPLPGREAQFRMASSFRIPEGYMPDMSSARLGGVLIALFNDGGTVRTILTKRPAYQGAHSGQVSFPGGKKEPSDTDIIATALRETQEEVGIAPIAVQIIGQLTELYVPASNFLVHPVVGVLSALPLLTPDPREVEQILLPDLQLVFQDENVSTKSIAINAGLTIKAPYFDVDGHTVWGATAMILAELRQVLTDVGFGPKV